METLSDTIFTGASSALPPEKPHRQRRAVLQTTIYLPTRCLRATSLQGKDPGHLLPEEISQANNLLLFILTPLGGLQPLPQH